MSIQNGLEQSLYTRTDTPFRENVCAGGTTSTNYIQLGSILEATTSALESGTQDAQARRYPDTYPVRTCQGCFACYNSKIAELMAHDLRNSKTPRDIALLLDEHDSALTVQRVAEKFDGEVVQLDLARATTTDVGSIMNCCFWTRDQVEMVKALMEHPYTMPNARYYREIAQKLLLSQLTLMSSNAQLRRFGRMIALDSPHSPLNTEQKNTYRAARENHPRILFNKGDLDSDCDEGKWSQKQDAWQMLACTTADAIKKSIINGNQLTPAHKKFLASAIPFLKSLDYTTYEDSGSWEEVEARRTSTLAWNISTIQKLHELSTRKGFEFIRSRWEREGVDIEDLKEKGMARMSEVIEKGEATDYPPNDYRYRETDAALIYLLELDIPRKVALWRQSKGLLIEDDIDSERAKLEKGLLSKIQTLEDRKSGGIARYQQNMMGGTPDCYQGTNFGAPSIQNKLRVLHDTPGNAASTENSAVEHFGRREEYVYMAHGGQKPTPAYWAHFNFKLATWAGEQCLDNRNNPGMWLHYREIQLRYMARGLSMITPEEPMKTISFDQRHQGITIPPRRIPEAMVTIRGWDDMEHRAFSPHTPLLWGEALARKALATLEMTNRRVPIGIYGGTYPCTLCKNPPDELALSLAGSLY